MPSPKPHFSRRLFVTDAEGTLLTPTRSLRVRGFDDHLEVGGRQIYLPYLEDVRASGTELHFRYKLGNGESVTEHFRDRGFFRSQRESALVELVERLRVAKLRASATALTFAPVTIESSAPARSELAGALHNRIVVHVHSTALAFPPNCPTCAAPAETICLLTAGGVYRRARWFVPACSKHPLIGDSIRVEKWSEEENETSLSFSHRDYARSFWSVNLAQAPASIVEAARQTPLAAAVAAGNRFVIFEWVFSALTVSVRQTSRVVTVPPTTSRRLAALRYSLPTAILGWWSIHGLFWTPAALRRNWNGGYDVTASAAASLDCKPIAPMIDESTQIPVIPYG